MAAPPVSMRDGHAAVLHGGLARGGREREREALPLEHFLERPRHLAIHAGHDPIQELDDPHLGAEARPHRAQLEPDGARPDHEQARGHGVEGQGFLGGHDVPPVEVEAGQGGGLRSRGDQDALGLEHLPVVPGDLDASGRGDARGAA